MNNREVAEAQALIDSVRKGTGELAPCEAVFPLEAQPLPAVPQRHCDHCMEPVIGSCHVELPSGNKRCWKCWDKLRQGAESGSQPAQPFDDQSSLEQPDDRPNPPTTTGVEPAQPATPYVHNVNDRPMEQRAHWNGEVQPFREGTRPDPKETRCEKCYLLGVPCAGRGNCGCACHNKESR